MNILLKQTSQTSPSSLLLQLLHATLNRAATSTACADCRLWQTVLRALCQRVFNGCPLAFGPSSPDTTAASNSYVSAGAAHVYSPNGESENYDDGVTMADWRLTLRSYSGSQLSGDCMQPLQVPHGQRAAVNHCGWERECINNAGPRQDTSSGLSACSWLQAALLSGLNFQLHLGVQRTFPLARPAADHIHHPFHLHSHRFSVNALGQSARRIQEKPQRQRPVKAGVISMEAVGEWLSSHRADTYLMPVELQWQLLIYDIYTHRGREGVYFNAWIRPHLEENLPGNFVRFLRSERNLWNYFNLHYRVYEPD